VTSSGAKPSTSATRHDMVDLRRSLGAGQSIEVTRPENSLRVRNLRGVAIDGAQGGRAAAPPIWAQSTSSADLGQVGDSS
jgi:hypothetical protein